MLDRHDMLTKKVTAIHARLLAYMNSQMGFMHRHPERASAKLDFASDMIRIDNHMVNVLQKSLQSYVETLKQPRSQHDMA